MVHSPTLSSSYLLPLRTATSAQAPLGYRLVQAGRAVSLASHPASQSAAAVIFFSAISPSPALHTLSCPLQANPRHRRALLANLMWLPCSRFQTCAAVAAACKLLQLPPLFTDRSKKNNNNKSKSNLHLNHKNLHCNYEASLTNAIIDYPSAKALRVSVSCYHPRRSSSVVCSSELPPMPVVTSTLLTTPTNNTQTAAAACPNMRVLHQSAHRHHQGQAFSRKCGPTLPSAAPVLRTRLRRRPERTTTARATSTATLMPSSRRRSIFCSRSASVNCGTSGRQFKAVAGERESAFWCSDGKPHAPALLPPPPGNDDDHGIGRFFVMARRSSKSRQQVKTHPCSSIHPVKRRGTSNLSRK